MDSRHSRSASERELLVLAVLVVLGEGRSSLKGSVWGEELLVVWWRGWSKRDMVLWCFCGLLGVDWGLSFELASYGIIIVGNTLSSFLTPK